MSCNAYTLVEITEAYCLAQFNDKRKHFKTYLAHAKDTWNELLRRTLHAFRLKRVSTKKGNPYPYVAIPDNATVIGLFYQDECGRLIPVYQSDSFMGLPQSTKKSCGCDAKCDCGGTCTSAHSFSLITKTTLEGIEKTWLETCKNGDVLEYREVPSRNPLTNTIETIKHQRRICKLETLPCGCIAETEENQAIFTEYCGCFSGICVSDKLYREGEPCETTYQFDGCGNIQIIGRDVKDEYVMQLWDKDAVDESLVPDVCKMAMLAGIEWRSVMFNPSRKNEARMSKAIYKEMTLDMIMDLNPIDLEFLKKLDSKQRKL